jgi:hypothetical protein
MNKDVQKISEEFHVILSSQPPFGQYYEGDIIEWIENQFEGRDIDEVILLRKLFLITAQNYALSNQHLNDKTVLNAHRVCFHFENRTGKLKLSDKYEIAQLVYLFRVLQKQYKFFENKDWEIREFLQNAFGIKEANIRERYTRETGNKPPKQLFRVKWEDL